MGNRPYNAGRKIVNVTDNMGVKGIAKMQGTTRIIYDSVKLATTTQATVLNFFEDVNTRKFPLTNISENKLQVAETIAMQRFSFMILETEKNLPQNVKTINTLAALSEFKKLYRSDMSFSIAQDQVVKKVPLQSMYSAFNRNAQFNGTQTFGNNPGVTTSFEISHDVFHFDNPIVIPPQIEFVANLQVPTFKLPNEESDWYLVMTLEGLGSLFAPKSTY